METIPPNNSLVATYGSQEHKSRDNKNTEAVQFVLVIIFTAANKKAMYII